MYFSTYLNKSSSLRTVDGRVSNSRHGVNGGWPISIVEEEKSVEVEQLGREQRMEGDTDEFDLTKSMLPKDDSLKMHLPVDSNGRERH